MGMVAVEAVGATEKEVRNLCTSSTIWRLWVLINVLIDEHEERRPPVESPDEKLKNAVLKLGEVVCMDDDCAMSGISYCRS